MLQCAPKASGWPRHDPGKQNQMISSWMARRAYPFYETRLRGRRTFEHLAEYEANQWISADELHALQLAKLQALLGHCEAQVPFYRRHWAAAGVSARDLREVGDLRHFPTIDKQIIRAHRDEMVAASWRGRTLSKSTGGSTGQPFSFEYTRESYERRMAVMMRGYAWAGWRQGDRRLDVWGTEIAPVSALRQAKMRLHDAVLGRRVVSCFDMTQDNLERYRREIDRYRPKVVVGYTSALVELARWIERHEGAHWAPQAVITAAEMLSSEQRALLERSFRAPVFHTYGCREFMLIGAECDRHDGYHLSADHLVVELTDDAGRTLDDGTGQVTVTDLHNFGMPFVRYLNGDLASRSSAQARCTCGRCLPLLGAVEGRRLDVLTSPDGRIIPGEFFPQLMKDFSSIEAFQVRQTREDRLRILLVGQREHGDADLARLRERVAHQTGPAMAIEVEWVDTIPLTPSGKRRVTIREIEAASA